MKENDDRNYTKEIRKYLKNNILTNKTFIGDESTKNEIFDLLNRTVQFGESNSALLIGPRGSGKTTLVNDVLNSLMNTKNFTSDSILVKLNGLIHTDDRLALKSTTSQMNLENVIDGKVFGSFAENLTFLLACLRVGEKHTSKSIIFILEEFDLFCSHHNQTLLYNLFDVSQSAQAPICILGVTCRLDVIELLEKRVKSRFSHRQFFLFPKPDDNITPLEHMLSNIERYLKLPEKSKLKVPRTIKKEWNSQLQSLFDNKKFTNIIQRLADIDISERTLKNVLVNVVFQLRNESALTLEMFQAQINALEQDEMVQVLQDLNVVELCFVISMKHHCEIYDNQPMNFEMIFSRYLKFVNSNSNIQNVQRNVVMKAFEHIQNMEIISMIGGTGGRTQIEYQFFNLLVTPQQISEAVKKSAGLPTEVIQWANSSLT